MKKLIHEVLDLLFPRMCVMCGRRLHSQEKTLCMTCFRDLPRTEYHLEPENPLVKLFYGRIPIERASSFFYYRKGNNACNILYHLKYYGHPWVGSEMGRCLASEILSSSFFEGIDFIVPIPLTSIKMRIRGYNQSEWLASGISQITHIPVAYNAIRRVKNSDTQTHKGVEARLQNVSEAFEFVSGTNFNGKHILFVDDVVTTGATICACAEPIIKEANLKISVLTLAFALHL